MCEVMLDLVSWRLGSELQVGRWYGSEYPSSTGGERGRKGNNVGCTVSSLRIHWLDFATSPSSPPCIVT